MQSIDEVSASPADFAVDPSRDFTRSRKLNFKNTIHTMLTMEGDCIQEELYTFFGRNDNTATAAAFCKQRQKLSDSAFPTLFRLFNSKLPVSLYKGKYHLIACDGTKAEIFRNPNDPLTFFEPSKASSRGFNQIYITAMYSILDKRFVDMAIQPGRTMNEYVAFCCMVDAAGKSDSPTIYFGDMGYASYNNFAHVIENDQYFLIRANDRMLTSILGEPSDDLREMDRHVDLILSKSKAVKNWAAPEPGTRYKQLSGCSLFEFFDEDHPLYRMSLRVIRFEIQNGVFENIITNLPDFDFDFDDFKELYFLRWNEELGYRDIKHRLCHTEFHSKRYRHIVQEVWARAILYNFSTAVISGVVVDKAETAHRYQVNFAEAFKTCREFLRSRVAKPVMDVASLIARHIEPIRPGRSFARQHRVKHPFSFWYRK